jgi:hemerythrin
VSDWEWQSSYELGIDDLDQQHRRILELLSLLSETIRTDGREHVATVLRDLSLYVDTHFTLEESLMSAAGYPALDAHTQVHRSFSTRIATHIDRHERGEDVARKLMSDLRVWWSDHILRDDRHYVPYLRAHLGPEKRAGLFGRSQRKA